MQNQRVCQGQGIYTFNTDQTALVITLENAQGAAGRIAPRIQRMPPQSSGSLGRLLARKMLLKGEHLQKTGRFSARGQ